MVPVASYLALRGKCRYCGGRISPRYAVIEAITGIFFAASFVYVMPLAYSGSGGYFLAGRLALICSVLIVVFMIDFEHYLILDRVVFPALAVLAVLNAWLFGWHGLLLSGYAALGLAAFFGLLYLFSRGRWIGLGDIKLALFLGFATPGLLILVNAMLAYFLGAVIGVGLLLLRRKNMRSELPFGTFLAISTVAAIFYGQPLLLWYLHLVGLGGGAR